MVRAWGEPDDDTVRAAVTAVDTEERRMAGSLAGMHNVIDQFLTEADVLRPAPGAIDHGGSDPVDEGIS